MHKKNSSVSSDITILFLIMFFGISGFFSLGLIGISWDEGLGNMFFGERYLKYIETGQDKYLDFKADLGFHNLTGLDLTKSKFRNLPNHYPPVMDIISAWIMHTFAYSGNVLDPVDAFHLSKILITILFLGICYFFIKKRLGVGISFWSLLFLLTFPRLWGDMELNPKDIPSLAVFTFFIFAFIFWYEKPSISKSLLVGVLFGIGLGIKANILFAPIVLLIGWFPWKWNLKFWSDTANHFKETWIYYLLMGSSATAVYILSWPYLYGHPERILSYFKTMLNQGDRIVDYVWSGEPLAHVIATTPEIMLLFVTAGLFYFLLKNQERILWRRLLLVWFIFPIFRISIPGQVNFDGIRHYYEFLPAAAIIAGYGVQKSIDWMKTKRINLYKVVTVCISIFLVSTAVINFKIYFPYSYIYYNRIVGGLSGAGRFFSKNDTTDYWGVSYREGLRWIEKNAEENSYLYVPVAGWLVEIPSRIWLRPDIKFISEAESDSVFLQTNRVYIMFINRPGYYNDIVNRVLQDDHHLVYKREVDDYPVLFIYQILQSSK